MSPSKGKQTDALKQAIETALAPASFISYQTAWSFTDDVQGVANELEKLIGSEPERAGAPARARPP